MSLFSKVKTVVAWMDKWYQERARLTAQLKMQFEESDRLEGKIKKNLPGLGFDV